VVDTERGSEVFHGDPTKASLSTILFLAFFVCLSTGWASMPAVRLDSIYPPSASRGAEQEVVVRGVNLEFVSWMRFSREGIRARVKKDEDGDVVPNAFIVTVDQEVPVGIHNVRVGGAKLGASNCRSFVVSDLPQVAAGTDNRTREKAFEVKLGSTVFGKAVATGYSWFRFSAEKGQRILGESEVDEYDTKFLPSLALFDSDGAEVLSVPQGNVLDFLVPSKGEWYVRLSDFLFKGGDDYVYRLTLSTRPYIDLVYPPVGKPGTTGEFTLLGRNLPGGRPSPWKTRHGRMLEQKTVRIRLPDRDAPLVFGSSGHSDLRSGLLDHFEYREKSPKGISNPAFLAYASEPIIYEKEEDSKSSSENQRISFPCAFVGKFFPYADKDRLRFSAKKGEVLHMEVFSERLGCSSHVLMLVERISGNEDGTEKFVEIGRSVETGSLLGEDFYHPATREPSQVFDVSTRDPNFRFEVPEDGEYRVVLYDLFNGGVPNPLNVYCLCIRKLYPGFYLTSYNLMPPKVIDYKWAAYVKSPTIRNGEILPVRVLALRKDGFEGPIDLELNGLPSKVSYFPKRIPAGADSVVVIVRPESDAVDWDGSFSIMGRATLGKTVVKRRARHASVSWSIAKNSFELPYVRAYLLNSCPISVLGRENAPVKLFFDDSKLVENARKAYESSLIKLEKADKDLASAKSREKDLRAAWKKAEDLFRSASKKASRDEKAKANAIKTLKMGADRARDVATKAKNELMLFDAHRAALTDERDRLKAELSAAEKRKANPGIDPVRVIDTFVADNVKLPVKLELAETCNPNAGITVCGHPAFWGRSGNIVKDVNVDLKKKNEGSVELDLSKIKLTEGTYPLFFSTKITGKYDFYSEEDAKEAAAATEKFKVRVKSAQEALSGAKKVLLELKAKLEGARKANDEKLLRLTEESLLARNNELKILETNAKRMDAKGKKAVARAKKVLDGSKKPKDFGAYLYLTPFMLSVREAPIEIEPLKKSSLKAGEKLALPVVIRRYGGFDAPVSLRLVFPSGTKGFSMNSTNVAKDMYAAVIEVAAAAEASIADELDCAVEATFKFNNQSFKVTKPFSLELEPALARTRGLRDSRSSRR